MTQGSLAQKLRILRAQRGLTVKDASAIIGVNRHTLRSLELGEHEPGYPTLRKIADGYGVPVEDLMEDPVGVGKAEAPWAPTGPSEFSKALTAPRKMMPLDDVVSAARLAAYDRDLNLLHAQLQAGQIDMPTYRRRLMELHWALFQAIDRANMEAG